MKIFEILQDTTGSITEENLIARLKSFDWKYEFSDDVRRQSRGLQAANILENAVYKFWKVNPNRAIELWNTYAPGYRDGVTPSFIHRLQAQEK